MGQCGVIAPVLLSRSPRTCVPFALAWAGGRGRRLRLAFAAFLWLLVLLLVFLSLLIILLALYYFVILAFDCATRSCSIKHSHAEGRSHHARSQLFLLRCCLAVWYRY